MVLRTEPVDDCQAAIAGDTWYSLFFMIRSCWKSDIVSTDLVVTVRGALGHAPD
ncbi:hypothetical protein P22_2933 [Propionispora sp. 2/2-37]|uniref:hypothetical protein n=1 Tax=Propionispora sp. 2/2-37 TaxID=1677858 RepID=UPI0006C0356F|nr:hypothetical protein [Propionispora sp. 2/2-37]CUH96822.1 hypothetical protein P22_2933 [Propionispora sp. 2/2-37]